MFYTFDIFVLAKSFKRKNKKFHLWINKWNFFISFLKLHLNNFSR